MTTISPDSQPGWSLNSEIKKRKTQTLIQQIEERHASQPRQLVSPRRPALRSSETRIVAPPIADTERPPTQVRQTTLARNRSVSRGVANRRSWLHVKRERQIIFRTAALISIIIVGAMILIVDNPAAHPPAPPLQTATITDLMGYLAAANLYAADVQTFHTPNKTWNAKEEIQFDVFRPNQKGTFVLLTYDSDFQAGIDAFVASHNPRFTDWSIMQLSNVILLATPATSAALEIEVAAQVNRYLLQSYRNSLPRLFNKQ